MSSRQENIYLIYIIWLLLFTILTNSYYDINGILSIDQLDSLSYFNIANSAPIYSLENIPYHHAQRFFLPYLIGSLGNLLKVF